jgi:hypothetical protein
LEPELMPNSPHPVGMVIDCRLDLGLQHWALRNRLALAGLHRLASTSPAVTPVHCNGRARRVGKIY